MNIKMSSDTLTALFSKCSYVISMGKYESEWIQKHTVVLLFAYDKLLAKMFKIVYRFPHSRHYRPIVHLFLGGHTLLINTYESSFISNVLPFTK